MSDESDRKLPKWSKHTNTFPIRRNTARNFRRAFGNQAIARDEFFGAAVGGDVAIIATSVALVLTEYAATVSVDRNILAYTDALILSEQSATVSLNVNVAANTDVLSLTEHAATVDIVSANVDVSASVVSLTLTEYSAIVSLNVEVSADSDSLNLTAYSAIVDATDLIVTPSERPGGGRAFRHFQYYEQKKKPVVTLQWTNAHYPEEIEESTGQDERATETIRSHAIAPSDTLSNLPLSPRPRVSVSPCLFFICPGPPN